MHLNINGDERYGHSRYKCPPNLREALTRRKPLVNEHDEAGYSEPSESVGLKRSLSAFDVVLYGVGGSIGAGIYALVGIGAEIAGPGIALSFLACGTACIFTSLAYAEFASRVPVAGSAYIYGYVTFGELSGFLLGWFLTLGYGFTAAVVARAWAEYLADFIRALMHSSHHDSVKSLDYLTRLPIPLISPEYTCSPLSVVIIALCTAVLVSGAKESSRFNNFMTLLNISVLSFVVFSGVETESILIDNLKPFLTHGINGVARGAGLVFFAYIGFDMVACLSEEVKDPKRNMPIGIVGSLLICTAVYVTVSLVVIGMAPISLLGRDVPITNAILANACCTHQDQLQADAADQCLDPTCKPFHQILMYGSKFVSFGSIFGLTSGCFTSLMGQPRIFYKMAQDGLLFEIFARVDPTTHVPSFGILITGIVVSFLACFVDLEALANLISLGTLMVFTSVDAGIIILRFTSHPTGAVTDNRDSSPISDSRPTLYTVVFTVGATATFASLSNQCTFLGIICAVASVASAIILFCLPQPELFDTTTFACPCVPLVPLIGIMSNAYMMGSLPSSAWLFAMVWLSFGMVLYFSYGIWHSKLGRRALDKMRSDIMDDSGRETTPLWRAASSMYSFGGESAVGDEELVGLDYAT